MIRYRDAAAAHTQDKDVVVKKATVLTLGVGRLNPTGFSSRGEIGRPDGC